MDPLLKQWNSTTLELQLPNMSLNKQFEMAMKKIIIIIAFCHDEYDILCPKVLEKQF